MAIYIEPMRASESSPSRYYEETIYQAEIGEIIGERCIIARWADRIGYIPGVGSAVGISRIITALTVAIFSPTEKENIKEASSNKYSIYDKAYLEVRRGLCEIIPLCTLFFDMFNYHDEKRDEQEMSLFFDYPCGRYIYPVINGNQLVCNLHSWKQKSDKAKVIVHIS